MVSDSGRLAVGVIGTGGMGGRHASNLAKYVPAAYVAAIMDVDAKRARAIASECGGARIFDNSHDLIHSRDVDALVVAAPDDIHAELVQVCLEANKPVLCEKPLATRLADAETILEAERRTGRKLVQVGFMRRYDNEHRALKREIDSGAIGRAVLYRGWHRNVGAAAHDMSSEMILLGSAIHDLDAMRWLLGQELESVYVEGVATKPALEEDVLDLLLLQVRLRGGCLASVEVYVTARYGYEVGVEIVGTQGTALIDAPQGLVVRRERWRGARIEADWLERFQQAYVTELRAWVEAVRAGTHTGPDAWAGYASLAGAVAAIEALQSGNPTPVPLQERPELYQSSDAGA